MGKGATLGPQELHLTARSQLQLHVLPPVSVPSSSFNSSEPMDYLRPVSESERLMRPRISQPSVAPNNSHISMVNQLGSQYNSVPSSNNLPGFSQSYQPELRNGPVYSQSNMPRMESNQMRSHMLLPSVNFSNSPFMSSSSYSRFLDTFRSIRP